MADIPTTNLDAGADSPAAARADLLAAVQRVNALTRTAPSTGEGAALVTLRDTAGRFAAGDVEGALAEAGEWRAERVNFMQFVNSATTREQILSHTCTTNLDTEIAAFRAALAASPKRRAGFLPGGVYPMSGSPNWAIQDLVLIGEGARFRNTGSGQYGFKVDGVASDAVGGAADGVKNVRVRGIIVEGSTATGDGVYSRANHYGELAVQVRGCGSTSAGYAIAWNVGNRLELTVDPNQGWYQGVPPAVGAVIDKYSVGADTGETSLCNVWVNIGGAGIGLNLNGSNMNTFKGFVQGCSNIGAIVSAGSHNDLFHAMTLESNTNLDFYVTGTIDGPLIDHCQTMRLISVVGAQNVHVRGGQHYGISFNSATSYCKFSGMWDRFTNGGYIADSGTYNSFAGARKRTSPFVGRPLQYGTITPTGMPHTITNTTGDPQYITVTGGDGVTLARGRRGLAGQAVGYTSGGEFMLESGDSLVISWGATAPTIGGWR